MISSICSLVWRMNRTTLIFVPSSCESERFKSDDLLVETNKLNALFENKMVVNGGKVKLHRILMALVRSDIRVYIL